MFYIVTGLFLKLWIAIATRNIELTFVKIVNRKQMATMAQTFRLFRPTQRNNGRITESLKQK